MFNLTGILDNVPPLRIGGFYVFDANDGILRYSPRKGVWRKA